MHRLFHTLCAIVCVAVIGAMMTHGVSDLRHEVSHAVLEQSGETGHDLAGSQSDAVETTAEAGEVETAPGTLPPGHHHHGGGDHQAALPDHQGGLVDLVNARAPSTALGASQLPEGLVSDGPEHPPKHLRLIA